jgi:hypothetical protein
MAVEFQAGVVQWQNVSFPRRRKSEGSEFVKGQPKDTNLDTYSLLRMSNVDSNYPGKRA